ncbi:hypothetical protein A4A49_64529 [Nicotiana attenuata]|uniref:CCHC-type domain-containing protein n=1 Tax=Nicotiana attenuata TaxID=49451 RepID=A0A1J6JQZ1_NICAT|nr:hypothetical protein A4A49_64529 [Nicotiana attenuata]
MRATDMILALRAVVGKYWPRPWDRQGALGKGLMRQHGQYFVVPFENMAGGTNAELRQRVEQLEALVGQALEIGGNSSVLTRLAHLEADYAARHETTLAEMALGQAAENDGLVKTVRQEIHNGKERSGKFKGCFTCGGPHLKKDCPMQARVNAMLAAEKHEQVAEANAIVADVKGAPGALFVSNPLGLIN